jgi:hypothetical protein
MLLYLIIQVYHCYAASAIDSAHTLALWDTDIDYPERKWTKCDGIGQVMYFLLSLGSNLVTHMYIHINFYLSLDHIQGHP